MASASTPPPLTSLGGGAGTGNGYIPQLPRHAAPSSSIGNLSPSILIIILILGVTIVASVSLCFLLRHLNRRCLRHLSSTSTSSVAGTTTAGAVSNRRVSPEDPTESLLDSLPIFAFSAVTRRSGGDSSAAADCAVCLSKFEPDDQLRLLPLCCHAFHAVCVDTWLRSNQTCPLCRSTIFASDADILKTLEPSSSARIEIGSISRRESAAPLDRNDSRQRSRSYSIGSSFEYLVGEDYSEIALGNNATAHRRAVSEFKEESLASATEPSLVADVASSGRSWLKEYVDRLSMSLSSRAASFRSSGRFFTGSSRRSDVVLGGGERDWDLEANRVGEEISELFRWVSGV